MDHVSPPFFVAQLFIHVHIFPMCRQDKLEANPPPPSSFLEFLKKMQSRDSNAPLDPQLGKMCIDDEFNYLAHVIDVCTGNFL